MVALLSFIVLELLAVFLAWRVVGPRRVVNMPKVRDSAKLLTISPPVSDHPFYVVEGAEHR